MPIPHERLAHLLDLYSSRKATPAEEQELFALVNETNDQQPVDAHIAKLLQNFHRGQLVPSTDWEAIYTQVRAKAFPDVLQTPVVTNARPQWRRLAAAACIIILLGTAAWYWLRPGTTGNAIVTATNVLPAPGKADIPAGKTGAILTLSSGKQIVLDSAANGFLPAQGNTRLQNHHGQLLYNNETALASNEVLFNTMTTTRGMQYKLVLADGSKVWLNAASSITFPTSFNGKQRNVKIKGEAYFEIAHDPGKPFNVAVNGMNIQVLGTHFNVNAYDDEEITKTTLFEGSIRLFNNETSAFLKPGQQAQINKTGNIKVTGDADLEEVIAWKDGLFIMKKAGIGSIMRQIARWYDVDVVYENGTPSGRISGDIPRNMNLSKVLEVMELSGVHFTIDGKIVKVKP